MKLSNQKGMLWALATALISGVSVYINKFGVAQVQDPYIYTTLKNSLVAFGFLALLAFTATARELRTFTPHGRLGGIRPDRRWHTVLIVLPGLGCRQRTERCADSQNAVYLGGAAGRAPIGRATWLVADRRIRLTGGRTVAAPAAFSTGLGKLVSY
jgi:hypothetical protein